jgi:hypothetical protein
MFLSSFADFSTKKQHKALKIKDMIFRQKKTPLLAQRLANYP